ncbi:hypothetical protein CCUS01_15845 [Colletotrichum cuscutae]|uniref:Uncharacterized protein n=1 Tax=Colletotrichum cuscutae TaxID=1209917 RepID=A0AAI9Y3R1_9PEZI|nr:hypothetical protein CCUS01_15845 [Colletotrichum cuscutae]
MRFAAIVTTLALLAGFAAAAPAVSGNAIETRQTRDGFYYHECMELAWDGPITARWRCQLSMHIDTPLSRTKMILISGKSLDIILNAASTNGGNNWRIQCTQWDH